MKNQGVSLLEVVLAAAILGVVFVALYSLLHTSTRLTETEISLRSAQFQLQEQMNRIWSEARESNPGLIRVHDFNDSAMATPDQSMLILVSARDAADQFQVQFTSPVWQKLIVYAPWFNSQLNTGELRRYEVSPVPAEFADPAAVPAMSVTSTDLQLGNGTVPRSGGDRVCMNFDSIAAVQSGTWVTLNLSMLRSSVVEKQTVNLQSAVKGRN